MPNVADDKDIALDRIENQIFVWTCDHETDTGKIGLNTNAGERTQSGNCRLNGGGDIGRAIWLSAAMLARS
jgi:hypothetical protein